MFNSHKLISKNGIWDLRIKKKKLVIYKLNTENKIVVDLNTLKLDNYEIDKLTLGSLGHWILWSKNHKRLYKSQISGNSNEGPFKMELDDKDGRIKILNKYDENILLKNNNDIERSNN